MGGMGTIIDRCNELTEHPLNHHYNQWKDRTNIDKAFTEWLAGSPSNVFTPDQMKLFAVYYAERVKGGKV